MKLLVNKTTNAIHDASNEVAWHDLPSFLKIIDVAGDAETFNWPHPNGPSACIRAGVNIVANPLVPIPSKSDAPLTVEELAAQMIKDGTMSQAKIAAIKAAR